MNVDKAYQQFAKKTLEGFRETLRQAPSFQCACCQNHKPKGEAAGAHLYKPVDPKIWKAMEVSPNQHRVGVYALCLECLDAFSTEAINQKVVVYLGSQGLFGQKPAE